MAEDRFRFEIALTTDDLSKNPISKRKSKHYNEFLEGEETRQRLKLQQVLGPLISTLVGGWLIFVTLVMIFAGLNFLDYHPSVLVTLLGSATASLIGLLMRVVDYVFPNKNL